MKSTNGDDDGRGGVDNDGDDNDDIDNDDNDYYLPCRLMLINDQVSSKWFSKCMLLMSFRRKQFMMMTMMETNIMNPSNDPIMIMMYN